MSGEPTTAAEFWATHCPDCAHEKHGERDDPRCGFIVGGDQDGPEFCECLRWSDVVALFDRKRAETLATAAAAAEKAKAARLQDALEGREKQSHDFAMDLLDRIHHWQSHSDDIGRTVLSELRSVYHASHRGKPVMRDGECLLCSALGEPPA